MKRVACCCCFLMIVLLTACTLFTGPAASPAYSKAEEICQLPFAYNVLGISPGGEMIILDNKDRLDACRIDGLSGKVDALEPFASLPYETNNFTLLNHKQLCWAKDGKTFGFMDARQVPAELMLFKSLDFHVCTLNGSNLSARQVTHEDRMNKLLKGGRLIYSPSLVPGDGGIVFTAIRSGSTDVCRADLGNGGETVLYHSEARAYIECAALSDSVFLCLQNGYQQEENKLFLVGKDQQVIRQIDDAALRVDDKNVQFDIEAWSEDRGTVLLARFVQVGDTGYQVDCYFVLKMSRDFTSCQVTAYPVGGADGEKRYGMSAALSPDGSYFVGCEYAQSSGTPSKKYLILYTIADGRKTELYSSDGMYGCSSPLNGNHEAIFLAKGGKMLVWFAEGYKLFQLK